MKKSVLVLVAFSLSLGLAPATPPSDPPYHLTTVSWVISTRDNLDQDDRYVSLIGKVTKKIDDDTYWFTDGTGSVRLDSGDFQLPVGRKVVIGGRIDQAYLGFGHLEVDVKQWHYAKNP